MDAFCAPADVVLPIALLTLCSNISRAAGSSLLVASLKGVGDDVAKARSWLTLCVWIGVSVVSEGRRSIIMVGSRIPRIRVPAYEVLITFNKS